MYVPILAILMNDSASPPPDLFCHGGDELTVFDDHAFELLLAWHGTYLFIR